MPSVLGGKQLEGGSNLAHSVEGDGCRIDQAHILQSKRNIGGHIELLVGLLESGLILLDG